MNIGIPKEVRPFEFRVGMTPAGVQLLCQQGHTIYVEHEAGLGAGFSDLDYEQAGARIAYSPHEVFGRADLLLKVARPLYQELEWLRPGTTLAGLLHLASASQDKLDLIEEKMISAIAYELIRVDGHFPVRRPLSEMGGRLAAQIGARLLENDFGGKGILLGGIPGVPPAEVVIIGAGLVGSQAVKAFANFGAHITAIDTNLESLHQVYDQNCNIATMISNTVNITRACAYADLVVSAVLVPGERAPIIISRDIVKSMKPRSVIMDMSIDEGGSVETSRPTTHEKPTFVEEGVIHYCVPNIPSVVARTSTYAFVNEAFPYILEIAGRGVEKAVTENTAIQHGAIVFQGESHLTRLSPHL